MATYVMMCNLVGASGGADFNHVYDQVQQAGDADNRVLSFYVVLGHYDAIVIAEAMNNQAAANLSLDLTRLTGMQVETMPALGVGHFSPLSADEPGLSMSVSLPGQTGNRDVLESMQRAVNEDNLTG